MKQTELHQVLPNLQFVSLMKGSRKRNAIYPQTPNWKSKDGLLSGGLTCPKGWSGSQ